MSIPVWRLILGGIKSLFVTPGTGTGGTISARYCYSVFLRHRLIAARCGMQHTPNSVIELGPGDSLGIGLMALLTGSQSYIAIDAVRHASAEANIAVLDQLVEMLKNRETIPFDGDCADIFPKLEHHEFPEDVFDAAAIEHSLAPERIASIRQQLKMQHNEQMVRYLAPFGEMSAVPSNSIDWILSQAVMEHVDNLKLTYHECFRCLKNGGFMTHQVDFRSHETAPEWNGHWKYPGWIWRIMRGRRPWFINREPFSSHEEIQLKAGFRILESSRQILGGGIKKKRLAAKFESIGDDDLKTAGTIFVAIKE